jgi:hypothetical protein
MRRGSQKLFSSLVYPFNGARAIMPRRNRNEKQRQKKSLTRLSANLGPRIYFMFQQEEHRAEYGSVSLEIKEQSVKVPVSQLEHISTLAWP